MTTPTTGYLVNSTTGTDASYTDLSYIFKPLVAGTTQADATGFKDSSGNDLNTVFNKLSSSSTPITYNTNMISLSGQDLRYVFAPYTTTSFYTVTAGTTYLVLTNGDYTGLVFYIPFGSIPSSGQMTGTITFNKDVSANIIIVGGGAGGGTYYAPTYTSNIWTGCGGGGGSTITVPLTLTGNTSYSFGVGQGGLGGTKQSSGNTSYFNNGSSAYNAGGGTVTAPDSTSGVQTSSGGNVTLSSGGIAPSGFVGGGGGGGGGEQNIVDPQSFTQGAGGAGGSYYGENEGDAGTAVAVTNNQWVGGVGGNSYFQTLSNGVSVPFSTSPTMKVGGGGAGGQIPNSTFNCGYAGNGLGGATNSNGYGYIANANNNSYTVNTVSADTYIPGGYGAGGGGAYNNSTNSTPCTDGYGGNGTVIIYWDNTKFY